jgi:sterol desaturase/sphingolipid hydroxylase (fatty acid hydroxylase superfamily)
VHRRFGHGLVRVAFVPALLAFAISPWLRWAPSSGWQLVSTTSTAATAPVLLTAMFVVWMVEQLYPANPTWNVRPVTDGLEGLSKLGRDLIYLFGVAQLSALVVGAIDPFLRAHVPSLGLWPTAAPFAVRVALAFFLAELLAYWVHRAAHRFRPLWQFHSTHHVITELNGLKSVRTHPVDNLLFYVGRITPLIVLGAGLDELLAAIYLGGFLGILAHANVNVSDRVLGLLVNFPQVHAVHHSADVAESNCNFGCHTVLWDLVFRTFRHAPQPGLQLGVAPVGPRTLWQELAWPFYRWVSESPQNEKGGLSPFSDSARR